MSDYCLNCLKTNVTSKCTRCRIARYCNRNCQLAHWDIHENLCIDSNSEDSDKKLELKASNHFQQGNYKKAEILYNKLLKARRRNYGDQSNKYLQALMQLALSCGNQGKDDEALLLHQESLEKSRLLHGEDGDTLACLMNIANVYERLGRNEYALVIKEQCYDMQKTLWGENHINALSAIFNLGVQNFNQHRYKEAIALYKECLEKQRRFLGGSFPDTLQTLMHLALAYDRQFIYSESEVLYRECFQQQSVVLGENHPKTLQTMLNLATCCGRQGKVDEAIELYSQCLEKQKVVLGENHAFTLSTKANLAVMMNPR